MRVGESGTEIPDALNDGAIYPRHVQDIILHNACSDFLYAARWPHPRFGAGSFRIALESLWLKLTGSELEQVR